MDEGPGSLPHCPWLLCPVANPPLLTETNKRRSVSPAPAACGQSRARCDAQGPVVLAGDTGLRHSAAICAHAWCQLWAGTAGKVPWTGHGQGGFWSQMGAVDPALWQGLLAGRAGILTKKRSFKTPLFLANPHCLCLTHFAREQGHTRSTELNSQTSPRRALEKLVTALTIHSSLTDAWKLHTSPSYEENGFSSPVLLRRAGINATLTLRHLFCPCWLHLSTCSCCGCREPANRCSPSLQVPLPVGPHVPMMPQPCCAHSTSIPGKEQPWQRPPPPGMHPKGM